jgi:TolA-binding protein
MEFLQKEGINTREELAAYRKPLEEQVLSLMKERRELYRKAPDGMCIQAINGKLKELRKKIRLSQQIEKQSLEMEERLRQAKEQEEGARAGDNQKDQCPV